MKPRIGKQQNWLHLSVVVAGLVFLTAGSVPGALEAHYRFNGNLRDETGRHDGKLCDPKSSPRFDLGKSGEALIIDSFGSAVEVANPGGIDLSRDFTIAAWINTVFAQEEVVVFKGHANGFKVPDKQFNLMGGQGPFIYAEDQGQWGASYEATHRIHLDDGNWHHVAVTYRSSQTPHFALYVDGLAKKPGDEGSFMRGDFVMQPDSSNSVARIGARANDDYPYFRGLLDEVQIYNQALDADQVRFLFQHPGADLDTRSVPHFPTAGRIEWDPGHPWRPPFGLDRIGQPCKAVVKLATDDQPLPDCWVTGYLAGKEIERHDLRLSGQSPFKVQVTMSKYPDELALFVRNGQGEPVELARQPVPGKAFEADAIAKPDTVVNPVDLGAILPPADRLCLGPGESGSVDVAALSRAQDIHNGRIQVWFDSDPSTVVAEDLELTAGQPARFHLGLPNAAEVREQDVLDVAITGSEGNELWRKQIKTMRVIQAPDWPKFGATETKLRYDAPISLLNRETGVLSTMPYAEGWSPDLKDVVVTFHNGSRFVFWRGSSYVPFWAGRYNTALSYEWAETSPPPDGFVDSVEPLMDKELRYGRVEVVESTAARVHVRWTYQSCDFTYKVWGDAAAEDFYFYPDGFGTRVLNLKTPPGSDYELSEFIILTPAAAYPFAVLPDHIVDVLYVDGEKREISAPFAVKGQTAGMRWPDDMIEKARHVPVVYRVRLQKENGPTAIYFNPLDTHLPPAIFGPFYDRGYMVTPVYWGSHWPLGRGKTTGYAIDNRIYVSPAHNSVMSWARNRPTPLSVTTEQGIDTLGRSKTLVVQKWVWLIGMSDAPDERLLGWAGSFSRPPSLELKGARLDFDSYVPERRAIRLKIEDSTADILIKPVQVPPTKCVNPVFELSGIRGALLDVTVAGRILEPGEYAWDGRTLWLNLTVAEPTRVLLHFGRQAE